MLEPEVWETAKKRQDFKVHFAFSDEDSKPRLNTHGLSWTFRCSGDKSGRTLYLIVAPFPNLNEYRRIRPHVEGWEKVHFMEYDVEPQGMNW